MYKRGDKVLVKGYGGATAILRVWDIREKGLSLCSEERFPRMLEGEEEVAVGFPFSDIQSIVNTQER